MLYLENWRTSRRSNLFVGKVKSRYLDTSHKFGTRLPHSVGKTIKLDKENKNAMWQDAIAKEIVHVRPALNSFIGSVQEAKSKLVAYKQIRCHMIFDIKLDFTRKTRYVAGGHTTSAPTSMTYSSVVARDLVRLVLLHAALNDINLLAADIGNAYLNAQCRE